MKIIGSKEYKTLVTNDFNEFKFFANYCALIGFNFYWGCEGNLPQEEEFFVDKKGIWKYSIPLYTKEDQGDKNEVKIAQEFIKLMK